MMHRIHRQDMQISARCESDAREIGMRLMACLDEGPRDLEAVFDRVADQGDVAIDRIEVDLGALNGPQWLETFLGRLGKAIEGELTGGTDPIRALGLSDTPTTSCDGITRRTREEAEVDALIFYLRRGRLPWWAVQEVAPGWLRDSVARLDPTTRRRLVDVVAQKERPLTRLVRALDAQALCNLLADRVPDTLLRSLPDLTETSSGLQRMEHKPEAWRLAVWASVFKAARISDETKQRRGFAAGVAGFLTQDLPPDSATMPDNAFAPVIHALPKPWCAALRAAIAEKLQALRDVPDADPHRSRRMRPNGAPNRPEAESTSPKHADGRGIDIVHATTAPTEVGLLPEDLALEPGEDVPVRGAGGVLLHPFLPELFRRTALIEDDAFVGEEAQHLAVRLLGYLLFGDAEAEEADLVFAKTLCGLDWATPLATDLPDPEALTAADGLLQAVLTHWTALKSASPDWLRAQFLMRDGLLAAQDDAWRLTVAPQGQDVLLNKLPWGYGTVMLPWLQTPITVRWRD